MTYRKVFWGVILLVIGLLFLLRNLGYIDFHWHAIWQLWPLLLLLWGISILPINSAIRVVLSLLTVIATLWIFSTMEPAERGLRWNHDYSWDDRHDRHHGQAEGWSDESTADYSDQRIVEPWDDAIESAVLRLDAAAGNFTLKGMTSNLMEFEKDGRVAKYTMTSKRIGSSQVIDLALQNTRIRGNSSNDVRITLNTIPLWDFDLDIGAADLEFDLSAYRVGEVSVDGGASAIDLRFGDRHEDVKVRINAGAASIDIQIPRTAGCEVDFDTFLASRDLDGFDKVDQGLYRTPDFDAATVKFYIKMDAAISSLEVKRY